MKPKKSLEQHLAKHKDDNNTFLHNSKRRISFIDSTPPDTVAADIVLVDCNKKRHDSNRIKLRQQVDIAIQETQQNNNNNNTTSDKNNNMVKDKHTKKKKSKKKSKKKKDTEEYYAPPPPSSFLRSIDPPAYVANEIITEGEVNGVGVTIANRPDPSNDVMEEEVVEDDDLELVYEKKQIVGILKKKPPPVSAVAQTDAQDNQATNTIITDYEKDDKSLFSIEQQTEEEYDDEDGILLIQKQISQDKSETSRVSSTKSNVSSSMGGSSYSSSMYDGPMSRGKSIATESLSHATSTASQLTSFSQSAGATSTASASYSVHTSIASLQQQQQHMESHATLGTYGTQSTVPTMNVTNRKNSTDTLPSNEGGEEEEDEVGSSQQQEQSIMSNNKALRRSSSGWEEMIERKKEARKKKKRNKEEKRLQQLQQQQQQQRNDNDEETAAVAVPTSVLAAANDAVQTWDANKPPPSPTAAAEAVDAKDMSPEEEEEAAGKKKKKKRYILIFICVIFLLILIISLALGLKKDDEVDTVESTNLRGDAQQVPTVQPTVFNAWILDTPVVEVDIPIIESGGGSTTSSPVTEPIDIPNQIGVPPAKAPVSNQIGNTPSPVIQAMAPTSSSPTISYSPTNKPSISMVETSHTVTLILNDVPDEYILSTPIQNSLVGYVEEMMRNTLDDSLELVSVVSDQTENRRSLVSSTSFRLRRLAVVSIPMQITVKGPASTSDLHLCYIMKELKNSSNLYAYLRSLDSTSFENVGIQLESEPYDSESCVTASSGDVPSTESPTPVVPNLFESTNAPTSMKPTVEPSNPPTPSPTRSPQQPCSTDLWACTDGTYVSRNPDDPMCNFFLCPNETLSPTSSPSRLVTARPTLVSNPTSSPPTTRAPLSRPTYPPTTGQPTSPPTDAPSPSPTTPAPTTPQPTDTTRLVCTPDPHNAQCGGTTLKLLEQCSSSDTVSNDQYGQSLAITSRTNGEVYAVVGAINHDKSGSAYLMSYDKSIMKWNHVASFIPGGASANGEFTLEDASYDQFGHAVAISNDWVAISAPLDYGGSGKVSLFWLDSVTGGGQLEPDFELVAADKKFQTRFGSSLALNGDTLVVGAVRDRENVGSVYVYKYMNGEWIQTSKLTPDDASSDSQGNFGHSVAMTSQGVLAVGAPRDGTNGRRRNGSVYVYSAELSGSYALLTKIIPPDSLEGDMFGTSLAVDVFTNPSSNVEETRLAIGTPFDDDKGESSGSVYMFLREESDTFSLEQKLTAFEWSPYSQLGSSVDMNDSKVIVGAKKRGGAGSVYYFQLEGASSWVEKGVVTPQGGSSGDDFGTAVAISPSVMLVGSSLNDQVEEDAGSMYSYAVCD